MTPNKALILAIEIMGGQVALGKLIEISQPSIHAWVKKGQALPAEHVLKVEDATGISRYDLRPDIYPREEEVDGK